MQITATEAKKRFCYVCALAGTVPVFIGKDARGDAVIDSAEQFEALKVADEKKPMARRQKESNGSYKDWIAAAQRPFRKKWPLVRWLGAVD